MSGWGGNSKRSQRWSEEDDQLLKEMLSKEVPTALIVAKLQRSWAAAQGRIYVLGLSTSNLPGRRPRKRSSPENPEA
jgi:uncharacterized protein YwlG (UPF0340 family)